MPTTGNTNIEIKARAHDPLRQQTLAESLADGPVQIIQQIDTFFQVAHGRLKLRELAPDHGELIFYERADTHGPKSSHYRISVTHEPKNLRELLSEALSSLGTVRKTRRLYLRGRTRIHCDEVEELGQFLELEVVLGEDLDSATGREIAAEMMQSLDIREQDLVAAAYFDLLQEG